MHAKLNACALEQAADFLRGVQMSANLGRLAAQAMREPLTQHEKEGIIVLTQVRPAAQHAWSPLVVVATSYF
jgi:hypothetical protein